MKILFLRHADAEVIQTSDEVRPLTAKGNRQARRVGEFLAACGMRPGRVLTSPLVRAQETAGLVAAVAGLPDPEVASWLACGMSASRCFSECEKLAGDDSEEVLLVGHEPDFSEVIGEWIGGEGTVAAVRVKKASLIGLDVSAFLPGGAGLEFLLPVRLISHAS
ncbi:MAG: phosphohistidine phosphatase SixA [Terrimicrobiaceae bacterium]